MLIVNETRRRQANYFVDQDRSARDKFYSTLNKDLSEDRTLKEMQKLIKKDPDFYDSYISAAEILFRKNRADEAEQLLKEAYERAIRTIVDYKGRLPKEMPWGYLENRHIMRAIEEYGQICWENGKIDEALDVYRKILRVNPVDNQGIRYNILAIKLGLTLEEYQKPFEVEKNGKIVGLDSFQIHMWFKENAPKFPDEFDWLLKIYVEMDAACKDE